MSLRLGALGSIAKTWGGVAKLHGLDVVRYTARELTPGLVKPALEHLPGKIEETGVNALILDTRYRLLEMVPMHLRLPYVQIWNVLHFDSSGSTPLALYGWPHETSPEALARNVAGLQIVHEIGEAMMPIAQSYAERNGLEIDWSNPAATVSKLAVITQTLISRFLICLRNFTMRVPFTIMKDGSRFPFLGRS
jgi:hypothetical protein